MGWLRRKAKSLKGKTEHDDVPVDFTGWNTILEGQTLLRQADQLWRAFDLADLEASYRQHAVIYACVREIATSIAEPPMQVGRETADGFEPLEEHYMLDLLKEPNPWLTYNDLIQAFTMRFLLTGKGYLWKWRSGSGVMTEFWPVPSSWVRIKPGSGNMMIERFEMGSTRDPKKVPPQDMVYFRLPDPESLWNGIGPLQAAQHDYQLDQERENYLVEMLTNLKVPGLTLRQEPGTRPLTEQERKEMRQSLSDQVGYGRRGGVPILPPGFYLEYPGYIKDMDWPGLSNLTEARICSAFGVPPIIVAVRIGLERSTYSNYDQAVQSFYRETLKPLWRAIEICLTKGLLTDEGDRDVVMRFDLSKISALQESLNSRAERAVKLFSSGIIPRTRAQEMVGEEAIGPNVFVLPPNLVEIPADDDAARLMIEREEKLLGEGAA